MTKHGRIKHGRAKQGQIGAAFGEALFERVQGLQGRAHISDGISDCATRAQFFDFVRNALRHNDMADDEIARFLEDHGELGKRTKRPSRYELQRSVRVLRATLDQLRRNHLEFAERTNRQARKQL
jgi:hypothetical protein